MKKALSLIAVLCLLLSGCLGKEPVFSVLSTESAVQSGELISSVLSIESEMQSVDMAAQITEITDIIRRYFTALENDDVKALAELTNYRRALFGYEKSDDGWNCPIKTLGNAIAYDLKIEYRGSEEATGWSPARESYYVTYEIDKENREYQNYLKNDPTLFDMYFNQETDDIYKLLDNGRYATWNYIGVIKDETTGNWIITGFGTGG